MAKSTQSTQSNVEESNVANEIVDSIQNTATDTATPETVMNDVITTEQVQSVVAACKTVQGNLKVQIAAAFVAMLAQSVIGSTPGRQDQVRDGRTVSKLIPIFNPAASVYLYGTKNGGGSALENLKNRLNIRRFEPLNELSDAAPQIKVLRQDIGVALLTNMSIDWHELVQSIPEGRYNAVVRDIRRKTFAAPGIRDLPSVAETLAKSAIEQGGSLIQDLPDLPF